MAKHCTVCDREYADELAACPHCASAKKTQLAGRAEDRTTQLAGPAEDRTTQLAGRVEDRTTQLAGRAEDRTTQLADIQDAAPQAPPSPSDSAIDFGAPPTSKPATGEAGGEPVSGASTVAWSSLVEEPPAEESKEIKIDSPSDADLLVPGAEAAPETPAGEEEELVGELVAEEEAAPLDVPHSDAAEEVVDLGSAPPQAVEHPSDSAVDLGGSPAELVEDSGAVLNKQPSGESEVFMAELASDAGHVDLVSDSGLDLSEGEVVEVVEEPAVEAAAPVEAAPPVEVESPFADLTASAVDAGVDEGTAAAEVTEEAALDAVMADADSSAVDLGGSPLVSEEALPAEEAGEIAEVAESSGIDLEGLPVPDASAPVHPASESSVDLGSQAEIVTMSPSEAGIEPVSESGINLESLGEATAGEAASDIALESLLSDSPGSETGEAAEEAAVVEEEPIAAEEAVVAEEEPLAGFEEDVVAEEPVAVEEEAAIAAEEAVVAEDEGVVAADEPFAAEEEAVSEEAELSAVDEPAVSEEEVNDLLAGLEEPPVGAEDSVSPEEAAEIAEGEEAIAAAEEEEAAAAAEEEEGVEAEAEADEYEKPAKPVKQRSRIPALVGGTFLGLLIGAGGLIGARFGGFDVPALIGVAPKEQGPARPKGSSGPQAVTFQALQGMVMNGDWEGAKKGGIENASATRPEELAARGDYRLGEYLNNVGRIKNPQDPALQQAIQDLQQAAAQNEPRAVYDLAWIKELAGQLPEARAEYAKGAQTFKDKPQWKAQFEAAVDRVDAQAARKAGEARLLPQRREDRAVILALLLVGLQQPPPPPPQPQPGQPGAQPGQPGQPPAPAAEDTREAGFEFWQAAKLARAGNYAEAIRAIDRARKLHDERRFKRLRRAQNPLSDPAEDIFLRCCDELKGYWQMENRLRDDGYLTDKNTPPEALQALLQKAEAGDATIKDLTDKLVAAKVIAKDDNLSKGLDQLISDKKDADAKVADLTTKLQKATDDNTKLADDLKATKKTLADRETALADAEKQNKQLKADNADLNATLKVIADDLANAQLYDPRGKTKVSEAVKNAVKIARIKDPQGMIQQQRDNIDRLTASLKERWQPEEMLPLWLLLLDENRTRSDLTKLATLDVERVVRDPAATPVHKGEAGIVRGLALRNVEKFAEAKVVLEAARGSVDRGEWLARADAALSEVSNPAAYFSRQAQLLADRGQLDDALAVLDRALKALPAEEQGKLLAQRSLIELDAARVRAKGTLKPNDRLILAARADAADAVKAGLAEGHYAAGRIAEELGQIDAAIKNYRAALAAHGNKVDAEGGRYRMALARVLLLPREGRPGQPAMRPIPGGEKVGWLDPAPYPARHVEDMKRLVLMVTFGLQAPLLPGEEPGLEEAEKLANEVLDAESRRPGSMPFNVVAQALAVKGRWNAALQMYVEGVLPMLPQQYRTGLMYLILNHPRLKRPDSLRIPNPMEAERHFAAGLNFYFDRQYANAEREFLLTIENDSGDARYFYYLGLSRLAQSRRRDAYDDFDQGAALEHLNRPAPAAVSESLERIQGPTRRIINEFRKRP